MRLLLIEDDAAQCEVIQRRVMSRAADTQIVVRRPGLQGPLAPEFLAQGYDAVLLGHGRGLADVRELTGRSGFAPVIFISIRAGDSDSSEAIEIGAHAVLGRDEIGSEKLFQ